MAFQNQLANIIGREVRVNRGGPDSITGKFVAVRSDYLVLKTKDGVIYVNGTHIKSITESPNQRSANRSSVTPRYIMANNFNGVLQSLRHQHVTINRGGPEKLEGVIADVTNDYMLLIVNREVVRIPVFHIKSIGAGGSDSNNNNNKSNGSNKSNGTGSDNKSSGKGSHKSGKSSGKSSSKSNGKKK